MSFVISDTAAMVALELIEMYEALERIGLFKENAMEGTAYYERMKAKLRGLQEAKEEIQNGLAGTGNMRNPFEDESK